MVDYNILIARNLRENGLFLVSQEVDTSQYQRKYTDVGVLRGIQENDFREHDYFACKFVPIHPVGRYTQVQDISLVLAPDLEERGIMFDKDRLSQDEDLQARLFDYQVIDGEIYIGRIIGSEKPLLGRRKEDLHRAALYFVSSQDGPITVGANKLMVNGVAQNLGPYMQYFLETDSYENCSLSLAHAGSARLHRKYLRPFLSRGQLGSSHQNGPWVVLVENISLL